jgi:hypothetical protein
LPADERIAKAERERLDAEAERERAGDARATAQQHREFADELDPRGAETRSDDG